MSPARDDHKVFIDRIEEDVAVLLISDDEEILLPRRLLPSEASEGDWLALRLTVDADETEARRRSVEQHRRRLGAADDGGDLDL